VRVLERTLGIAMISLGSVYPAVLFLMLFSWLIMGMSELAGYHLAQASSYLIFWVISACLVLAGVFILRTHKGG